MWELDCEEGWVLKNWCFWTVVLEKTFDSPLACKEIQPAHPKGNQSWIFSGRTEAEAETPILWPPDAKNWCIGKDPDAGQDWRWEEKGIEGRRRRGWDRWTALPTWWTWFWACFRCWDGQGSLAYCSSWDCKESDTTERLNWTEHSIIPGGSDGKESCLQCRKTGFSPWLGRSPGGVNGYPLQYSGGENSMDCIVHGDAKHWTRLSDFHTHTSSL